MNNMTGDPNQENRPSSIFDFDKYPCPVAAPPIDWNRIPFHQNEQQPSASFFDAQPPPPPPPQSTTTQFSTNYQPDSTTFGNFAFSTQTPNPVQFPFPTIKTTTTITTTTTATTIEGNNYGFRYHPLSTMRFKRKTESPPISKPIKRHITEEKMAEHMSKLHISSETLNTTKETETERTRRLYMCEEMRKLQADSILPQSILSKIQRPCTALVLWTPPRRLINLDQLANNDNNNNDNNNNNHIYNNHRNNNADIPDNNKIANDSNVMDMDNL